MNYYVYILYSPSLDKFYTGMSKFSVKRKRQHVKGQSSWTSKADDWIEVWKTQVDDSASARELEKKIKKRGAKRYLQDNDVAVPPSAE
jgi:putative endonuclease